MQDKNDQIDLSVLNSLDSCTRAKVNESLKSVLEHYLVENVRDDVVAAEHTKESGPLHSKEHTKEASPSELRLVERIEVMDDSQFQKFADRLSKLKGSQT